MSEVSCGNIPMEQPHDIDELNSLVAEGADREIRAFLRIIHPADIADLVESLDDAGRKRLFEVMDPQIAGHVVSELEDPYLEEFLEKLRPEEISKLVEGMDSDDAADILNKLPEEQSRAVMGFMDSQAVAEVGELLLYPEDTAGGIMQAEVLALNENTTVARATDEIRAQAEGLGELHNVYITDDEDKLKGVAPLRSLILAGPDTKLKDIMKSNIVSTEVYADQEEVADLFRHYDLVSLPVVDENGVLMGRVTVDDVMDVMEEEADEDFLKMAGSVEEEMFSSFGKSLVARFPWLLATWFGGLLTALILTKFEATFDEFLIFIPFLPLILAMGGNVGAQSATIVVRGLATGRLDDRLMWKVVGKEMLLGLAMGAIYGLLLGAYALYRGQGPHVVALIIGVSLTIELGLAATSGVLLPIVFHRLKTDPALATAPFITTFMDIIGASLYFTLALVVLTGW